MPSEDLLRDIHIRLDRQGLEELSEKEMMVLLSEDIAESTEYLGEYLGGKIDQSTAQILDKIDQSTSQMIATIHQTVRPIHFWAKVIGSGIWAVAASLIASIIFRACGG